ncbi:kinase [Phenylobacterium sp.]|uniref:kinase n=1 Tax=Phenylobacterium sp. TaxID=1871053 RepID=UPI00391DEB8D
MSAWLDQFLETERLPGRFAETVERVCRPLADRAARLAEVRGTAVIGMCGAQGSGKSTIAAATVRLLEAEGRSAVALSLDDFYLGREARAWLAGKVHPLLATRGPPGTHDVALACGVLDNLARPEPTPLPAFDKGMDERRPRSQWRTLHGPVDVVIFEGWCVGAKAQPAAALAEPVNALEAEADADSRWRAYVNAQLAGPYQALFGRLHMLTLLAAPGFEVVQAWRAEQEHKLIARTGRGMSEAELARFVAHYERLTRWILAEMPARADMVVELDPERRPLHVGLIDQADRKA